jgi:hypothetical protein
LLFGKRSWERSLSVTDLLRFEKKKERKKEKSYRFRFREMKKKKERVKMVSSKLKP